MSVTITFHTVAEKVPEHNQEIIWLRKTSSFGYDGFEPQYVQVEYQLTELDEDGEDSGNAWSWIDTYTYKYGEILTDDDYPQRVDMLFDCYRAQPDDLWIDQDEYFGFTKEEYWKCFNK